MDPRKALWRRIEGEAAAAGKVTPWWTMTRQTLAPANLQSKAHAIFCREPGPSMHQTAPAMSPTRPFDTAQLSPAHSPVTAPRGHLVTCKTPTTHDPVSACHASISIPPPVHGSGNRHQLPSHLLGFFFNLFLFVLAQSLCSLPASNTAPLPPALATLFAS